MGPAIESKYVVNLEGRADGGETGSMDSAYPGIDEVSNDDSSAGKVGRSESE